MKFKVGDKVVCISKTYPGFEDLDRSCVWKASKKRGYAYVSRIVGNRISVVDKMKEVGQGGDYFRKEDLILFEEQNTFEF